MSDVAKAIALPGENPPVRFPSYPALERTSVLRFNTPKSWALGSGARRVMLARQPAFPLWMEDGPGASTTNLPWSYTVGWITDKRVGGGGDQQLDVYTSLNYANAGVQPQTFISQVPTVSGVTAPPCVYPPLAVDMRTGNTPWVWVPKGADVLLSVMPDVIAPGNYVATVNGAVWGPGGEMSGTTTSLGMVANSFGATVSLGLPALEGGQWWKPKNIGITNVALADTTQLKVYVTVVAAASTITIVAGSTTDNPRITCTGGTTAATVFLPAVAPSEFQNSPIPWQSTRTTAVASLFTNTTKVLDKEGTVMWGRINPDARSPFTVGVSDLQILHPSEKAYMGLEQGTYTYVPPSTDQGSFWDHTLTPTDASSVARLYTTVPTYRLDNTALVVCGFFDDPDGGTKLAINLDWHVEFRNTSALFPIGLSRMTLESFHQAQLALVEAGFFYQNESHRQILGKVLSAIKTVVPPLLKLHPIGAAALSAVRAVGKAYNKKQKRKPRSPPRQPSKPQPQPPKTRPYKSGLDMFLNSKSDLKPSAQYSRPRPTSGKGSGFK